MKSFESRRGLFDVDSNRKPSFNHNIRLSNHGVPRNGSTQQHEVTPRQYSAAAATTIASRSMSAAGLALHIAPIINPVVAAAGKAFVRTHTGLESILLSSATLKSCRSPSRVVGCNAAVTLDATPCITCALNC